MKKTRYDELETPTVLVSGVNLLINYKEIINPCAKTLRDAYATTVGACAGTYFQHLLARACAKTGFEA